MKCCLGSCNRVPTTLKLHTSKSLRWPIVNPTNFGNIFLSRRFVTSLPILTYLQQVNRLHRRTATSEMSQDSLVDILKAEGVVKHQDVESALRATDRRAYCPAHLPAHYVYQDHPLPIGYGETISAPSMHAICLELLRKNLKPGARVLDVGSGSGYLTAAMALMVQPNGKVIGIEKHTELTEFSKRNIVAESPDLLKSGLVELRSGNIFQLGEAVEEDEPPFDAIHVGAAAERLPELLVQRLAPRGRMVIPVGPHWDHQVMQCIDKDASGHVRRHDLMAVRYVPLTKP